MKRSRDKRPFNPLDLLTPFLRSASRPGHLVRLLLVAILLLTAGLRVYRLDAQSLWNDEGNSARIAERSLDLILEGAAGDIHPPGYYLLLHAWRALFGQSEVALRSLSVVAGLALVAFTYLLARRLFGEGAGLVAALLGAISPFAVYYSQEARMYALLGALSASSTALLFQLLGVQVSGFSARQQARGARRVIAPLLYVVAAAAGLYTQYAFVFVLLVHNCLFGLWWLTEGRRSGGRRWLALWIGTQAAVAALYLPWLPSALGSIASWSSAGRSYELGPALVDVWRVLTVGVTLPAMEAKVPLTGAALLLMVGLLIGPRDRPTRFSVAALSLCLLLPLVLIFGLDLYKPEWRKFLVVVLPPFHALTGRGGYALVRSAFRALRGTDRPPRVTYYVLRVLAGVLFIALVVTVAFPSLHNLYFDPACARDDYRQIAADIEAAWQEGDGVLLNAPNQWEVFTYYFPDRDVHPVPYRASEDEVDGFLSPLAARYRRLFVLYWGDAEADPQRRVETWLAANAYKANDHWYGRVRLATYRTGPLPSEQAVEVEARFGERAHLLGYALPEEETTPGGYLPVTLFWQALGPILERYKVTVQLLDPAGQLVAQHDAEPGGGFFPTDGWTEGATVVDRHGVALPASLPPARYTLAIALYHAVTGERLPVTLDGTGIGDLLPLSGVEIKQ